MEHHVSFPFTRGALLRLCAVACVDAKRLNLVPLVEFMTKYRDLTVKRVNVLAVHPQRQLNVNILMAASPRWVSIDLDAQLPLKKAVLPKAHFLRWFRYNVHDPSAEQLRDDREFSGAALTRYQQVVFEPAIVDALRRGRRPDEIATMSHHDMVMMRMLCYAKYLRPTAPALTTDDVERVVIKAHELPFMSGVANIHVPPGVDIEPVGVATLRHITTTHRTFPCATVVLEHENKKDVNDRGKWRPKPEKIGVIPVADSEDAKMAACSHAIDSYAALKGFQIRRFNVKKHGVFSLFGAGSQPACDEWIDKFYILSSMMEREGSKTWATLRTLPYANMTTRQLNGLTVGLMTKDEIIESLPANLMSRANAAEMRSDLGIGVNGVLADATVERLRLFILSRSSTRLIEVPSYHLLERRKALMGAKSAVVADGFVISVPFDPSLHTLDQGSDQTLVVDGVGNGATELSVICGVGARALLATALCADDVGDTLVINAALEYIEDIDGIDDMAAFRSELARYPSVTLDVFNVDGPLNSVNLLQERVPNPKLIRLLSSFGFKQAKATNERGELFVSGRNPINPNETVHGVYFTALRSNIVSPERITQLLQLRR